MSLHSPTRASLRRAPGISRSSENGVASSWHCCRPRARITDADRLASRLSPGNGSTQAPVLTVPLLISLSKYSTLALDCSGAAGGCNLAQRCLLSSPGCQNTRSPRTQIIEPDSYELSAVAAQAPTTAADRTAFFGMRRPTVLVLAPRRGEPAREMSKEKDRRTRLGKDQTRKEGRYRLGPPIVD